MPTVKRLAQVRAGALLRKWQRHAGEARRGTLAGEALRDVETLAADLGAVELPERGQAEGRRSPGDGYPCAEVLLYDRDGTPVAGSEVREPPTMRPNETGHRCRAIGGNGMRCKFATREQPFCQHHDALNELLPDVEPRP